MQDHCDPGRDIGPTQIKGLFGHQHRSSELTCTDANINPLGLDILIQQQRFADVFDLRDCTFQVESLSEDDFEYLRELEP